MTAFELIATVLEDGSFESWDKPVPDETTDAEYRCDLADARRSSGVDEAVVTGSGRVGAHRVAVVIGEFGFLGGSIGVAAATRVIDAVRRATALGLPLLAAPASGGTRMQEGARAFVQMIAISAAIADHRRAGLPYLVYLRNPTTGGVYASWGSLGHVTAAEPGALIGFLGPRVYRAVHGHDFPDGVQRAENLRRHGLVDAVLGPAGLPDVTSRVLDIVASRPPVTQAPVTQAPVTQAPAAPEPRSPEPTTAAPPLAPPLSSAPNAPAIDVDDWTAVERSRRSGRPGLQALLQDGADLFVPLSGTGRGERDPALRLALARFGGHGSVVLGQDRLAQSGDRTLGPGALRTAARGVQLAEELRLPIVTVIDTPGAAMSPAAEEGGLAGEIARTISALLAASVPVVAVLLGQGAGGAALALLPADRIVAAEHAWLAPLPPEGASAVLRQNAAAAPRLARHQRIAAPHLLADGIVDEVVAEHGDRVVPRLVAAISRSLSELADADPAERCRRRATRFSQTTEEDL